MTPSTPSTPSAEATEAASTPPARKPRIRPATIAIATLTLALGAMWIYAWFLAPRGNVDRFEDRVWADQAERVCAATRTQWLALPTASAFEDVEPKAEALRQRAAVVEQVTTLLTGQVADLRATPPTDEKGREGVALWLGDWDGYLASRRAQADRLRAGQDDPFTVPEEGGAPVTLRMDAFAKTNGMPSCIVPDDVG